MKFRRYGARRLDNQDLERQDSFTSIVRISLCRHHTAQLGSRRGIGDMHGRHMIIASTTNEERPAPVQGEVEPFPHLVLHELGTVLAKGRPHAPCPAC